MRDKVRIGGLYRCCLETLEESNPFGIEGDEISCVYCGDYMRFNDGAWEWSGPWEGAAS